MPKPAKFTRTAKDGSRHLLKGIQRIQCFIPEDVVRGLKMIGAAESKPFSDVIGEALSAYVKAHKVKP